MCCECVSPQLGVLSPQWVQALFSCALVLICRLLPLRAALRLGEDRRPHLRQLLRRVSLPVDVVRSAALYWNRKCISVLYKVFLMNY